MTKSFIEEVKYYLAETPIDIDTLVNTSDRMGKALIAIDDMVTNSKHGFASELAADIREILEGEQK